MPANLQQSNELYKTHREGGFTDILAVCTVLIVEPHNGNTKPEARCTFAKHSTVNKLSASDKLRLAPHSDTCFVCVVRGVTVQSHEHACTDALTAVCTCL